jgi:hypothetical protein
MSWLRHNQEYQKRVTRSFKEARDKRKEYESEYLDKVHKKPVMTKRSTPDGDRPSIRSV